MTHPFAPFSDLDPEDYARSFVPVPTRARRDGWTAERQRRFILALRESGDVADAGRSRSPRR